MADEIVAEISTDSMNQPDVEVVRESDVPTEKPDVGESLDSYVAQRKAEHPEWYPDEQAPIESPPETVQAQAEEVQEAEVEVEPVEPEPEEATEPESQVLRRVLAREAKLRESQTTFEAQKTEHESQLKAFQQAQTNAKIDPVAFLKAAGLDQEALIETAKALYYESLGDLAPDEYRGKQETLQLKRDVAALKARLETEQNPQPKQDAVGEAIAQYQDTLMESTKSFDTEKYPTVAKVVDAYSEADVAADMFKMAEAYAQQQGGAGQPLTPDQCLQAVEAQYAKLIGTIAPKQDASKPEAVTNTPATRKTLSNNLTKEQPPANPIDKDMSYEEVSKMARNNFFAALDKG